MINRSKRTLALAALAAVSLAGHAKATAYLFWMPPNFTGAPVKGDEPGIGLAMPGATSAELQAHLLWNMRAGLNVAALQCQFSPALATVKNYNTMLGQHSSELAQAYSSVSGYFKRTGGKAWQTKFDNYTTKTYNGFSTMHAQLGFCETAGAIGRDTLGLPKGQLFTVARDRMREFRNSLVPVGDRLFAQPQLRLAAALPPLRDECWKDSELREKCAAGYAANWR